MVRIEMHAMYDHFPEHHPVDGEPFIHFYSDTYVDKVEKGQKAVAMLLEPRSMIGPAYEFVEEHGDLFGLIFTHDSRILKKWQQAWFLNWGDVWFTSNEEKTKGISIMSSWKNWCPLHNARISLAKMYDGSGKVDCFGSFRGDKDHWDSCEDAHKEYRFAIVLENDIDDLWYTEKLLNCFSNKVVPIYVGATRIGELFNEEGIIQVSNWQDIPAIVDHLDIEAEYESRLFAVNDNFERVKPYTVPWKERFFRNYGRLLEDFQNG